jgi:acetylornithine/succinyldiaminopimelate/putrescine aminotransferase
VNDGHDNPHARQPFIMEGMDNMLKPVKRSLRQLLGDEFSDRLKEGALFFGELTDRETECLLEEEVDFLPDSFVRKNTELLDRVGSKVISEMNSTEAGAATDSFQKATDTKASPVGGLGVFRLGEDGRLYLISKSEHYHAPLGHGFPGYKLLDRASALGIGNATHNNTRGYITRLSERELIRHANGIKKSDEKTLERVLTSREEKVLNRVINLQTGSLAAEAGIKMMVARFYSLDKTFPLPKYEDRIPVFLVMGDYEGGGTANYHGTTIFAQTLRDMWPGLYNKMEKAGIMKVCTVNINDIDDLKRKIERYNRPPYKTAGFLHEIILMNYGAIRLEKDFLRQAYSLCKEYDTPVMVDEIQSCMWYKGMFLFRLYELDPDFVIVGKGFPGGRFAGSKIITTAPMDSLNQFGALVTNGQEELTSLAYLITMVFAEENEEHMEMIGEYYEKRLNELAIKYTEHIRSIEGLGLLQGITFDDIEKTVRFTKYLQKRCIDISAQTYKASCPPTALTKLPVISVKETVDYLIARMEESLKAL